MIITNCNGNKKRLNSLTTTLILHESFPPPHTLLTSELVIVLTHLFWLTDWIFKENKMWKGVEIRTVCGE